jgi:hypothetical protein
MINTWECLIDSFDTMFQRLIMFDDFESFNWLWCQTENRLFGQDALNFQGILARSVCLSLSWGHFAMTVEEFGAATRSTRIKQRMISDIEAGNCKLLSHTFDMIHSSITSYLAGKNVLDTLILLGVDVELWVSNELKNNAIEIERYTEKRVTFESDNEGGWKLGFEWARDEGEPGFLVCSEFDELACSDTWFSRSWPYGEGLNTWYKPHERPSARFNRRMASKAHKERKRAGMKIPRSKMPSKMPGSWN